MEKKIMKNALLLGALLGSLATTAVYASRAKKNDPDIMSKIKKLFS
jgi:uncharacterized phage infection (PIP) family protein YhgE